MLRIMEALLLILSALGQDLRAADEGQIYPLDMAPDSVDDQYDGCTKDMANLVKTKYLEKETSYSPEYHEAWKLGEQNSTAPEDNLTKNHSVAIYVYTNSEFKVYADFNDAVRNGKQNYTDGTFMWSSLHFLLTDAIQILNKTLNKCYATYRGTSVQFNPNVLNSTIRFGSFTSSSLGRTAAEAFGNVCCFEIYTCEGADLTKYSKHPEEKEVLIPPYETFRVTAVRTRRDRTDLWCDTVFELSSAGRRSDLNCALCDAGNRVAFLNVLLTLTFLCKVLTS